jgi:methionyl-tRNA formyltransferase
MKGIRIAYAANRPIGVQALQLLLDAGIRPLALLGPTGARAGSIDRMRELLHDVPFLPDRQFREEQGIAKLRALELDYILSVHFPFILPPSVLEIPALGCLNLHPAYLPYNRGWHTPSWAILEGTPIGATLHWIDAGIDSGDIALQADVKVCPADSAHRLYQRVLAAELALMAQAIPMLCERALPRRPQSGTGSSHAKADLEGMRELDLNRLERTGSVIDRLRALTTNSMDEAAYFKADGKTYRVRVEILEDEAHDESFAHGRRGCAN